MPKSQHKRELILLYGVAALVFLFTSREPYAAERVRWSVFAQLRSVGIASSLAVQPILAIAGWTLHQVKEKMQLSISIRSARAELGTPYLGDVLLLALALLSVQSAYAFSRIYIGNRTVTISPDELRLLQTDSAQWVHGLNHEQIPTILANGGKVAFAERPWSWKGREPLYGYLEIMHNPTGAASSQGGRVDVRCDVAQSGTLRVLEYRYSSWRAFLDGRELKLDGQQDWLTVAASPGKHVYQFRYQPWDVYAGMLLSLVGWVICAWLWLRKTDKPAA